ncbi:MAG: hypothetical protein O2791_07285, partial [Bacteroidetes bacterium]|nr:hypothetical protein [Bacteroidota bacterium]
MQKGKECGALIQWKWQLKMGALMAWLLPNPSYMMGQTNNLSTWSTEGVVWCGDPTKWLVDSTAESVSMNQLASPVAGHHILWGCPTMEPNQSDPAPWRSRVVWNQDVSGSNANRSTTLWAVPPSSDAAEAAEMLAQADLAGWLDETGGFSAGTNGSEDPLECHAPGMTPWELPSTCHDWSEPFQFDAEWTWDSNGLWTVRAWDERHHRQSWVDTLLQNQLGRPCIGINIDHTSSNGDRWKFGWQPLSAEWEFSNPMSVHVLDSSRLETTHWQTGEPSNSFQLEVHMACDNGDTLIHSIQSEATQCENVWQWALPCPLEAGHSLVASTMGEETIVWRDGAHRLSRNDLAFTEIMPDPTPATYAPESTYLELFNTSDLAFDPERLFLVDGDDTLSMQWVHNALKTIHQRGQHWIICDQAGAWHPSMDISVLKAIGWSGLRDAGEYIEVLGPNKSTLEDLTFFDTWWGNESQDGRSLSCVSSMACDNINNWKPDPNGASPGKPAEFIAQEVQWPNRSLS